MLLESEHFGRLRSVKLVGFSMWTLLYRCVRLHVCVCACGCVRIHTFIRDVVRYNLGIWKGRSRGQDSAVWFWFAASYSIWADILSTLISFPPWDLVDKTDVPADDMQGWNTNYLAACGKCKDALARTVPYTPAGHTPAKSMALSPQRPWCTARLIKTLPTLSSA